MRFLNIQIVLVLVCLSGCGKLSNSFSEVKLECGSDAPEDRGYIQVLDPRGEKLTSDQIIIRALDENGQSEVLKATSKGCFSFDNKKSSYVVSSSRDDMPWGAVVDRTKISKNRQIRLADVSQSQLRVECPSVAYTSSVLKNPVLPDANSQAFPYALRIIQDGARVEVDPALRLTGTMSVPGVLNDGPFTLEIAYQNLFKSSSAALTQSTLQCAYNLDREAPVPVDSLAETLSPDLYRVHPGAEVKIELGDSNADSIHYCVQRKDETCEDESTFLSSGSSLSFQAPDFGHWCLIYYGLDKAGNRSPLTKHCAISYQAQLIENIKNLAEKALTRINDDRLLAATFMARALSQYLALPTEEEKLALSDNLLGNLLTVGSSLKETSRIQNRAASKLYSFSSRLLTVDGEGLILRDPKTLVALQELALAGAMDAFVRGDTLLVRSRTALKVFELEEGILVEKASVVPPGGVKISGTYTLHPTFNEVIYLSNQDSIDIYRQEGLNLNLVQVIPNPHLASKHVWSAKGDSVLFQDNNLTFALNRTADGNYALATDVLEDGFGNGVAYLKADDSFVVLTSLGVHRYRTASGFEKLEVPEIANSLAQMTFPIFTDRMFSVSESEVIGLVGTTFYSFQTSGADLVIKPAKGLENGIFDTSNLKVIGAGSNRLTLQFRRNYFVLEKRHAENHWHIVQNVLPGALDRRQAVNFPDLRLSVVMDQDLRLVSLNEKTVFGSFLAEDADTASITWLKEGNRHLLATNSYTSAARLWSEDGVLETSFVHNDLASTQVFLSWNKKLDLFTTAGEDGNAVVYDRAGRPLHVLNDQEACGKENNLYLRYVSMFAEDDETLITSGMGALNVWTKSADAYSPLTSCAPLGRSISEDSRTRLEDVRTFRWQDRELIFAAPQLEQRFLNFFEMDGTFSSVWKSGKIPMNAAALDQKAKHLALAPIAGGLELHELTDDGFNLRSTISAQALSGRVERITFSHDNKFLAVFVFQKYVKIFENSNGQLIERFTRPLAADAVYKYYLPFWFDKSFVYFDKGTMHIVDENFKLKTRVSAFGDNTLLTAASYNAEKNTVAVQQGGEVKLLPLDLHKAHKALCDSMRSYLETTTDFLASDDSSEADRDLCEGI